MVAPWRSLDHGIEAVEVQADQDRIVVSHAKLVRRVQRSLKIRCLEVCVVVEDARLIGVDVVGCVPVT